MKTRRTRKVAFGVVMTVAALVASTAPAGAADPPPPTVVISPTGPWLDQHDVTVTGGGLAPNTRYELLECVADACIPSFYYLLGGPHGSFPPSHPERSFITDATGAYSVRTTLFRTVPIDFNAPTDCSLGGCDLAVTNALDNETHGPILARTPLTFTEGTYVWPNGTLSVTPTAVRHRSVVSVTATGLDPNGVVSAPFLWEPAWAYGADPQMCVVGPEPTGQRCRTSRGPAEVFSSTLGVVPVAADGSASGTARVDRFVRAADGWTDCARWDCTMRLFSPPRSATVEVPLDLGPVWAPFASAAAMVDGLRTRFDARELSASDRALLIEDLEDGDVDAFVVVSSLASQNRAVGDVATLYSSLLHRRPELEGLIFWVGRMRAGTASAGRVADTFSNTPEVTGQLAGLSDAEAVEWAYQATLGRGSDPSGKAYWVGRLAGGLKRFRMLSMFALAPESKTRTGAARLLTTATYGFTGQVPTADAWAATAPGQGAALTEELWALIDISPVFQG